MQAKKDLLKTLIQSGEMLIVYFLFNNYILRIKHLLFCSKFKCEKNYWKEGIIELLYFMSWLIFKHISFQVSFLWITSEGGKLCIFLCFPGDIENQPLLYNRKHKKQWRKLRWRSDSCSAVELNRPICCIISSAPKWLFIDEDCFIPKLGKWWKVLWLKRQ